MFVNVYFYGYKNTSKKMHNDKNNGGTERTTSTYYPTLPPRHIHLTYIAYISVSNSPFFILYSFSVINPSSFSSCNF